MDQLDIRSLGLVALVAVAVVWMFGRTAFRKQRVAKTTAQLDQEAAARGWTVQSSMQGGAERYLIKGHSDGINWQLESYDRRERGSDPSGSGASYTRWSTEAVTLPGEMLVVLDASWRKASGVTRSILPGIVKTALDADGSEMDMFKKTAPVEGGSEALRKRSYILASPAAPAERFLSEGAEAALLGWSGQPRLEVVALWQRGLVVEVIGNMTDAADCERLAQIGVALARAARSRG